ADYTYNRSGRSPASPSLAILPDGRYIASHDVYWGLHGQCLTLLFQSADRGANWSFLTAIEPCFWGKLFVHRGDLYMLATATEYGALLIRRSTDGGATWSHPAEILPPGSRERGGPHKAPMPVQEHAGRLWSAVEHGSWSLGGHAAGVVSVPVDADLLDPAAWAATPFLPYDPAWPGTVRGGEKPGVLEGNVVVTPAGELVNVLRYNTRGGDPPYGRAIVLDVAAGDPRAPLRFRQVIDFPGNMSKFTIRHDPISGRYWSLVNRVTSPNVSQRNILTLTRSHDLVHWEIVTDILNYEANGWPEDLTKVGFQYVDWLFDGDDLIAASRTALGGAHNYHNANHLTFHRIRDFRAL
ncbi:MAG TPA: sialidase family protein, partial [Limnochordia bacterium]|nr:sialidase family protein [Limnochordia bacterium]